MKKVRSFSAFVTYRTPEGETVEESLPLRSHDFESANNLAFLYVLQVMKLEDFELRVVGAWLAAVQDELKRKEEEAKRKGQEDHRPADRGL